MSYGMTTNNKLRLFVAQTLCDKCGERMINPKKDTSVYVCRRDDSKRAASEIMAERKYFEVVKRRLESEGIKAVMVHQMNHDTLDRGKHVETISVENISNPSIGLFVGLAAILVMRKVGIRQQNFVSILNGDDGYKNTFWRISETKDEAGLLSLIEQTVALIKKGFLADDHIYEAVMSDEDVAFSASSELLNYKNSYSSKVIKAAEDKVKEYTRKVPSL